jgi:hypothetical protein
VKAGSIPRENSLVHTPFQVPVFAKQKNLVLEEIAGGKRIAVSVNTDNNGICWIMSGKTPAGAERNYELHTGAIEKDSMMRAIVKDGAVILQEGTHQILQYNMQTVEPPAGSDTVFRRSGFIHPLWAPNGAVLTNIFPNAGHRHHMGIWNPWTHTMFEGRETDFWNVQKKQGKVRFKSLTATVSGNVSCGFEVQQEHVAFLKDGTEKVAMTEWWTVAAYPATNNGTRRQWDFVSAFCCNAKDGITLMQYRYGGGFGLRTTPDFTATTSQLFTSEGKTRKNADSTRARWVKITGTTPQGKAGLLIMNYPENFDSPEPLRVWPEDMEGGELMFNFTPTRMKPWQLYPGEMYVLKYRVMVYNGELTPAEAEAAWQEYAYPPEVVTKE